MPAAAETHGDTAVIIATARRMLAFGQRLDRRALVQRRTVDVDQLALTGRGRIVGFKAIDPLLQSRGHVDAVTLFRVTIARSRRTAARHGS